MKKSILLLLCVLGLQMAQAQITKEDYKSIIPFLQAEDWKDAYKASSKLLKDNASDTSEYKSMVAYFNVYAAAGMASDGKMKRAKLQEIVAQYKGQKIFMAGHIASKDGRNTLNKTFLSSSAQSSNGFTTVTNKKLKTLLMEDITFAKKLDLEYYFGSTVRCGGTLTDFEVNLDEKNTDWLVKFNVSEGFIRRTK